MPCDKNMLNWKQAMPCDKKTCFTGNKQCHVIKKTYYTGNKQCHVMKKHVKLEKSNAM